MKKFMIAALTLAAVSSFAGPGDSNWALRLGPIFPRLTGGVKGDVGASFSVAYRLVKSDSYTLEIESLGTAFSADSIDFTVSNLNLVGLFTPKSTGASQTTQFFAGAVVGYAKPHASAGGVTIDGDSATAYGPIVGAKLNKQWSVEARYLFCDVPASRGTQILFGYRF